MSLNAATIEALIAKGLGAQDILDIARATEVKADPTNAARQARHRARKRNSVTVTETPPYEVSSTPSEVIPEAKASSIIPKRKAQIFVCPDGVDPTHWRDFMENRKRKHLAETQTAYELILSDLAKHSDSDWPPGRLVQHAAGKGWGSINDPRTSLGQHQNGRPSDTLRGSRPDPSLDFYRAGAAREAAERAAENPTPDRRVGASLPAIGAN